MYIYITIRTMQNCNMYSENIGRWHRDMIWGVARP